MTIEIVEYPIKDGDFPVRYVNHYQVGYSMASESSGISSGLWKLGNTSVCGLQQLGLTLDACAPFYGIVK